MSKNANVRSERIDIRTNPEVKAVIEQAAQLSNTTVSAYLLDSALQKAREDLRNTETLVLHESDRKAFYSALMAPPAPNAALRKLLDPKRTRKA